MYKNSVPITLKDVIFYFSEHLGMHKLYFFGILSAYMAETMEYIPIMKGEHIIHEYLFQD